LVCPPLSVLIAAYNEEEGIVPTIFELKEFLHKPHLVVVDGNSSDRTLELAQDLGAEILLQRGKGKGDAISQGLNHIDKSTNFIALIDADYTYPAKYLKEMIQVLEENPKVGMVLGNRFSRRFKADSDKNRFYVGNKILGFAQNILNGIRLKDPLTGLRVIKSSLLRDWSPRSDGFGIEVELNYHIEKQGYDIVEIPIIYRKRLGKKKLGFRHGLKILQRIIIESISN
jgi:dolichol-phosphate mannosyltransferase